MIDRTLIDMLPVTGCDCFVPSKRRWKSTTFQLLHPGGGRPDIRIAESTFRLAERQVLLVQPGKTVSLAAPAAELRCIAFRSPFLEAVFDRFRSSRPVVSTLDERTRSTLLKLWTIQTAEPDTCDPLEASCLLLSLVAELIVNVKWSDAAEDGAPADKAVKPASHRIGDGKFIIYAARYMKKRMADSDLSLLDVARAIGYHPNYFAQQFRQVMNISPMKYLKSIRVERALELLERTEEEVQAICEQVGIRKSNVLSAMIKEKTGLRPVEFRRQAKISRLIWNGAGGATERQDGSRGRRSPSPE